MSINNNRDRNYEYASIRSVGVDLLGSKTKE